MSRKEKKTDYAAELEKSFERWEYLKEHGGSDPSYSDGVNMNLVRNHILYFKHKIESGMSEKDYPQIYFCKTPPETDRDYMARADEIRENARSSLEIMEQDENLLYLRERIRELSDRQIKDMNILVVINYPKALHTAIAEDDLITMRRFENTDNYLESFRRTAEKAAMAEPEENLQLSMF